MFLWRPNVTKILEESRKANWNEIVVKEFPKFLISDKKTFRRIKKQELVNKEQKMFFKVSEIFYEINSAQVKQQENFSWRKNNGCVSNSLFEKKTEAFESEGLEKLSGMKLLFNIFDNLR